MVATNRCAASLLATAGASGPFVVHDGFRRDRLKDRDKFMQLYVPDAANIDPDTLEGYRDLLRQLASSDHELPLRSMINRLLTRARLAKKPGMHMGMSLPLYTNCTSPLRKYLDFLVHLQIKAVLRKEPATLCAQPELDALNQRLLKLRQVSFEAERWLTLEYLQRRAKTATAPWAGRVSHMGNMGFSVRLEENGLEGYVDLRKGGEKFTLDKWTATLQSKTRQFRVDTPVLVTLSGVDKETPHLPLFALTADSGLKTGPEAGTGTAADEQAARATGHSTGEAATEATAEATAEAITEATAKASPDQ
jgi:ribonuclease R